MRQINQRLSFICEHNKAMLIECNNSNCGQTDCGNRNFTQKNYVKLKKIQSSMVGYFLFLNSNLKHQFVRN